MCMRLIVLYSLSVIGVANWLICLLIQNHRSIWIPGNSYFLPDLHDAE